jgi:hypothetical protein
MTDNSAPRNEGCGNPGGAYRRKPRAVRFKELDGRSFLARRTIKSAPVADGDSLDRARAETTLLSIAVVDPQLMLKLTEVVLGVAIIRKRRAAPADRFVQDGGNHRGDFFYLGPREPAGAGCRSDTDPAKDLIRVDIADSRDNLLIEQKVPNPAV